MNDDRQKIIFSNNLNDLLAKSGKSQKEVAERIHVSPQTFNTWCRGIALPRMGKVQLLADYFGVNKSDLIEEHTQPALPPYDNIRPLQTQILPVLGRIAAGEPILMEEEREVYVETQIKADFILIVEGDSMIGARIYNGDIVFVRQQPTVENGEIAVVAVGDSATLKRFYKYDNMIVLRPENPEFREQVYQGSELENIRVLGKAIAFQSDIK